MAERKFLTALRACKEDELTSFREFVASPFYNKRMEWLQLLDYILPHWPDFDSEALDSVLLFRAAFPEDPYDDKNLRYALSGLNGLLQEFWAITRFRADERRKKLELLDVLSERGLDKSYRSIHQRLAQSLSEENSLARNARYFQDQLQWIEVEEREFERRRIRKFDDTIQRAANTLDRYYYLQRLKLSCAMLDRQTILQGQYELGLSQPWLEHLATSSCFEEPAIQLFFHILKALQEESDESWFFKLKALLDQPDPSISIGDLRDSYRPAINYCARKMRQGRADYTQEALSLYVTGIEKGYLLENGELSPWTFTNVVKLSLRLQRYEWIESFMQQYAPLLSDSFRHNARCYNLAELYYYTGRFQEAQTQLNEVAWSDLNYYLGARVMLAKIYYEQQDEEPLLSLIASFTIFLKRNKEISANLKQTYLNFCEILFQLVRRHPQKMTILGEKIQQTDLLTDRAWLLTQWEQASK